MDFLFLIDLIGRINTAGKLYWKKLYNWIDGSIVIISILGHIFAPGVQSLTALRVIRLLRMFRILTLIPNIDHILAGIGRALKASRGVF